jgi:chromosome segregation ATPase
MSNLTDAADVALQLGDRLQAFVTVANALKTLGSIDTATAERKQGLIDAVAAHQAMLAQITVAQADLDTVEATNAANIQDAKNKIADLQAEAEKEADDVRAKAAQDAATMLANAQEEHNIAMASYKERIAAASAQLVNANSALAQAQSDRAAAQTDLAALQTQRDDIAKQIDDLKAAARNVLA